MPQKSMCFVIMAIGDQPDGTKEAKLRSRYEDTIRAAIQFARPNIIVKRADDSDAGGSITDEILEDILQAKYVVADISYPNPNVFYELGLRHASHASGTILLRHADAPRPPFDITVLRYQQYDDSATGLNSLKERLARTFDHVDSLPDRPDNQFQLVASRLSFGFPRYDESPYDKRRHDAKAFAKLLRSPLLIDMVRKQQNGEQIDPMEILAQVANEEEETAEMLVSMFMAAGDFDIRKVFSGTK